MRDTLKPSTRAMRWALLAAFALVLAAGTAHAQYRTPAPAPPVNRTPSDVDKEAIKIIDTELGQPAALDVRVVTESGETVPMREVMAGDGLPVILVLAYYRCASLCTQVINGVAAVVEQIDLTLGKDYRIVTFSIAPGETAELAQKKKTAYLDSINRPDAGNAWRFLVAADDEAAHALADSVGFGYEYSTARSEYMHSAGIFVLTGAGTLSTIHYGIDFDAQAVRISLVTASEGRIGTVLDQFYLFCFTYNSETGKYSVTIFNILKITSIVLVLAMATALTIFFVRDIRRDRAVLEEEAAQKLAEEKLGKTDTEIAPSDDATDG